MILELADIRIDPGKATDFEAAILRGASTVIAPAKQAKADSSRVRAALMRARAASSSAPLS